MLTVLYFVHYDTLLQNVTAILLQNARKVYYKICQLFHYKMRKLLKNASVLLQNATVITKCVGTIINYALFSRKFILY